uniref:Uncharacterized protein n=1 Tax=Anguilla anguilla TaxID=7936 RepID=A0A0E9U0L6_ANGAN
MLSIFVVPGQAMGVCHFCSVNFSFCVVLCNTSYLS